MLTFSREVQPSYQYAWKSLVNSSTQTQYTQDEAAYYLTFNLPGFRTEDVRVNIEKGILEVAVVDSAVDNSGSEVNESVNAEGESTLWNKRYRLPEDVDLDQVGADLKLGQLLLTLNKKPQEKPVKIEIKS